MTLLDSKEFMSGLPTQSLSQCITIQLNILIEGVRLEGGGGRWVVMVDTLRQVFDYTLDSVWIVLMSMVSYFQDGSYLAEFLLAKGYQVSGGFLAL